MATSTAPVLWVEMRRAPSSLSTTSGGQDPSPTFLNEQSDVNGSINGGVGNNINGSTAANIGGIKKDSADLIIGSWNDEDTEKVHFQTHLQCYLIDDVVPFWRMYISMHKFTF